LRKETEWVVLLKRILRESTKPIATPRWVGCGQLATSGSSTFIAITEDPYSVAIDRL
jgi:hypothetical protein